LSESEPSDDASTNRTMTSKPGPRLFPGISLAGYLALGQAVSGVKEARTSCGLLYGTREPVVSWPHQRWWEREYAEVDNRRREYRMRRTGADWGVVVMKGL
jgi:hypothetical protein